MMKSRKIKKEIKQRRDKKELRQNVLRFKGSSNTFINQQINVKFYLSEQSQSSSSSLSSDSQQSPPSLRDYSNLSIIPTFNKDFIPHTPTFYIPFNKINSDKCMQRHIKKQEKYQEIDEQQILVAKPRKRPYCHACDVRFDDYLEHLSQKRHQQSIIKHPIHKDIIQLCNKFNLSRPKVADDPAKTDKQSQ